MHKNPLCNEHRQDSGAVLNPFFPKRVTIKISIVGVPLPCKSTGKRNEDSYQQLVREVFTRVGETLKVTVTSVSNLRRIKLTAMYLAKFRRICSESEDTLSELGNTSSTSWKFSLPPRRRAQSGHKLRV